jgi:hypothetical protein
MLSVVIVSRNDNYGGNLIERATYCINSFLYYADEVIYVDWNSQGGTLAEVIKINDSYKHKFKLIPIRSDFVEQLSEPPKQLCCEALGRNIGIRRATGDWILCTNIDIITTPIPIDLDKNKFYNLERRSICLEAIAHIDSLNPELVINFLKENKNSFPGMGEGKLDDWDIWSHWRGCGDFQLAHKDIWEKVKGYEESMTGRSYGDTNLNKKIMLSNIEIIYMLNCEVFHIHHWYSDPNGGSGGLGSFNDINKYIRDFQNTENKDTWGFSDKYIQMFYKY